ncbi:MAG: tetratricopeptide repeat protein [Alphaproteobacteria bacterium]|nr:tetratricopeptide repeat protein [Alphaproteobacteria bacterium]
MAEGERAEGERTEGETQAGEATPLAARLASAVTAHRTGDLDAAIAGYRAVLESAPDHVDTLTNLGVALRSQGDVAGAIAIYERGLAIEPGHANANYNLGNALRAQGEHERAAECYRAAIAAKRDYVDACANLALSLRDLERYDEALAAAGAGLRTLPRAPSLWANLGAVLWASGRAEAAVTAYRRSLALDPEPAAAHLDLAQVLYRQGEYDGAAHHAQQALARDAALADAHCVIAKCLAARGRFEDALAQLERARAIEPDNLMAKLGTALTRLLMGDLKEGFKAYQCRWELDEMARPEPPQPRWDGGDLSGKRILLTREQGFGDTIHAIRYAPLLAERGARVIAQCQPPLVRLVQTVVGVDRVVPEGSAPPAFDTHASLLDLPELFGTELATIPAQVPYFDLPGATPDDDADQAGRPLRIGIAWAGKPTHNNDANRSCALETFLPLFELPGTRFYSFQIGERAADIAALGLGAMLTDASSQIGDFLDSARLVARLDLVISVDTALVHLAGALARPVWVLLPHAPDWRWMHERTDSPWYPTMRLYRQPAPRSWGPVVEAIAGDLRALTASRQAGGF